MGPESIGPWVKNQACARVAFMYEGTKTLLAKLEKRLDEAEAQEREIGRKIALLDDLRRWRDPEKEPPSQNENLLLWVESAYDVGYLGFQGTWYYFSHSRRNFHEAPKAWLPLPPPPK